MLNLLQKIAQRTQWVRHTKCTSSKTPHLKLTSKTPHIRLNQIILQQFSSQNDKYSKETISQLKEQAKLFYENNVKEESNSIEINNLEQWKSEVLECKDAIVLNCYAEQTYLNYMPKLVLTLSETKAKNSQSKWKLINLNIDHFGEITLQLQIKQVPTVMLIYNGNTIDGFSGVPDDKQFKEFFETVEKICEIESEKDIVEGKIQNISDFLMNPNPTANPQDIQNYLDEAKKMLNNILTTDLGKNIFGARLNILLGYISASQRNKIESKNYIERVQQHYSEEYKTEEIQEWLKKIYQIQEEQQNEWKGDWFIQECVNKMELDPGDLQVRFTLAEYQFKHTLLEDSIEGLLQIIKINRNWENRKAHTLLLKIFETLGTSNTIVVSARKKLQKILY